MHTLEYYDKKLTEKCNKYKSDRRNFWNKYYPKDSDCNNEGAWNKKSMGEYPPEYVLIGKLKEDIISTIYYNLFAKKTDNRYHYLMSNQKEEYIYDSDIKFFQEEFSDEIKKYTNVSKPDFSEYISSDCILNKLYFKNHLIRLAVE